ncbi:MAG: GDSL-type esterase/lipase family protein [Myxococcota bacterium]
MSAGRPPAATPPLALRPAPQDAEWAAGWWHERHAKKRRAARRSKARLLFLGDSITENLEGGLGRRVMRRYYRSRRPFNLGFAGDRTEQVLWRLSHGAVDDLRPEVVVLLIGTNNTGHRMDAAADTAAGIARIVDELHARLPESQVLLLGLLPREATAEDPLRRRNEAINARIATLPGVTFLDVGARFVRADGSLREDLLPDGLHLDEEGYRVLAEAMEPTLARLLGDRERA